MIVLCIITLFCSNFITNTLQAQSSTIVRGYVYIDSIITKPEEIQLIFPAQSRIATIYDDGRYIIVFEGEEPGNTGTFNIIYSGNSYEPPETVTLIEGQYAYNIDLHIETSNESQPPEEPDEPINIQPVADAGGPYYEIIDIIVYFNASGSYDEDGVITKYEWDFGDGNTSNYKIPIHIYSKEGNYSVKLTVTDDEGATDTDITFALITKVPNYPPNKPQITGSTTGNINKEYNLSLQATDPDGDPTQYKIDWNDDTEITTTEFIPNGTTTTVKHNWTEPGIYTIKAYAIDDKDAISEITEQVIFIDTIYCKNLGYLTDYTSDGIYDLFYSNSTSLETPVELINGLYLIDIDNNGEYDYQFNTTTNELSTYGKAEIKEQEINLLDIIKPYLPYVIIFLMIVLLILIAVISISLIKQKPKVEKIFYIQKKDEITEKKITAEKTETSIKNKGIKSIEEEIDELLSRREKYKRGDFP